MPDNLFLMQDNQRLGPLSQDDVTAMARSGQVTPQTPCWAAGMPEWAPLGQVMPALFAAAPPPPSRPIPPPPAARASAPQPVQPQQAFQPQVQVPVQTGGAIFDVVKLGMYQMPKISIRSDEVVLEAGALHYMVGQIEIESALPSVGGFLKSALTNERAVKPRYRGTGDIYLEPTFGEVNVLELNGDAWVLDKGAFLACEKTVEVGMYSNKAFSGLFGGEGFFQTQVSGYGKVFYLAQGPVQRLELDGSQVLTVDGSFAVARTASLEFEISKATKGLLGTMASGEGLVNRFRGRGVVLIAPIPNQFVTMLGQFASVRAAVASKS
jgi:uncharacterized protein (AIM24 family)